MPRADRQRSHDIRSMRQCFARASLSQQPRGRSAISCRTCPHPGCVRWPASPSTQHQRSKALTSAPLLRDLYSSKQDQRSPKPTGLQPPRLQQRAHAPQTQDDAGAMVPRARAKRRPPTHGASSALFRQPLSSHSRVTAPRLTVTCRGARSCAPPEGP